MIIHNCALAYSFKIQLVLPEETIGYVEETCVKPERELRPIPGILCIFLRYCAYSESKRELRPIDIVTIFIFVTNECGIQLCPAQLKLEHKKSL